MFILWEFIQNYLSHLSCRTAIADQEFSGDGACITSIIAYSKGLACSGGKGTVHLFEKTEDKESYRKSREIKVKSVKILGEIAFMKHILRLPYIMTGTFFHRSLTVV